MAKHPSPQTQAHQTTIAHQRTPVTLEKGHALKKTLARMGFAAETRIAETSLETATLTPTAVTTPIVQVHMRSPQLFCISTLTTHQGRGTSLCLTHALCSESKWNSLLTGSTTLRSRQRSHAAAVMGMVPWRSNAGPEAKAVKLFAAQVLQLQTFIDFSHILIVFLFSHQIPACL